MRRGGAISSAGGGVDRPLWLAACVVVVGMGGEWTNRVPTLSQPRWSTKNQPPPYIIKYWTNLILVFNKEYGGMVVGGVVEAPGMVLLVHLPGIGLRNGKTRWTNRRTNG